MTDEGLAVLIRVWIVASALFLVVFVLYTMIRMWSDTSLGQKFFGVGLILIELALSDYAWVALANDHGWRWTLLFLVVGQLAFVGYFSESIRQRRINRASYLKAFEK